MNKDIWAGFYTMSDFRRIGILLSQSRICRLQAIGQFPKPYVRLGSPGRYPKAEIDAWLVVRRAMSNDVRPAKEEPEQEERAA